MDSFIINAIISGIGIALITGLLGCFVVWRKMAYFGESLGHSAMLGIGAGILMGVNSDISIIVTILIFALVLTYLQSKNLFSDDIILGVLAHGALSIGVILISLSDTSFNLHSFLFGEILAVTNKEIYFIFLVALIIYFVMIFNWKSLLTNIISRDLAKSQNISNFKMDLVLSSMLALGVAVSIKIIGILLVTSMLIIPPATAKQLVKNPKNMVITSIILASLALLFGILSSYHFDVPSGPAIVLVSFVIFFIITLVRKID
jgi:zinc transport system permease protein